MNPSTACAEVVVDELVRHGVRDAVLCPGSRSAPLAFALHAADVEQRLRLHVRVDERSAAFLAVGLAKGSGRPVPVVTTSGTAVANLHPAVLEASHSGVPLLLLTADRPPELRGTGANQTTEQPGIFGSAVRWQHDLGTPDTRPGQVPVWRSTVSRAVAAATGARGEQPGPVHLNLPFREPLVPGDGPDLAEPLDGRPDGAPWTAVVAPPAVSRVLAAPPVPDDDRRTLMVVGDLPLADVDWGVAAAELAVSRGWPLIAEPSSGGASSHALPHGTLLLSATDWLASHRPERVVVVGRPTLARPVSRLLADPAVDVDLVAPPGPWPDPAGRARSVLPLESLLVEGGGAAAASTGWAAEWAAAAALVSRAVAGPVAESWPSGVAVARTLTGAVAPDAQVFAGSSNSVRDLELAGVAGPRVVASRGLAGIDGCLSTASGLALASERPTYALVGDLTFLHDVGGLVVGPPELQPDLTVVVVNDDGGGIFTLLEPGAPQHAAAFERVFGTPHAADLAALSRGAGARFTSVSAPEELAEAVAATPHGVHVVEVRVDRAGHRDLHARLRAVAADALR
ncbi:MAG: 2-succinyl-5-enolpyruvyl-6-hydroxy-3-cyclohexene-1-carboxylic-acid synthase [Angustibacter sp.]